MKIMAFDPFVPAEAMEKEGVIVAKDLKDLYSNSNFVSLHIPVPILAVAGSGALSLACRQWR